MGGGASRRDALECGGLPPPCGPSSERRPSHSESFTADSVYARWGSEGGGKLPQSKARRSAAQPSGRRRVASRRLGVRRLAAALWPVQRKATFAFGVVHRGQRLRSVGLRRRQQAAAVQGAAERRATQWAEVRRVATPWSGAACRRLVDGQAKGDLRCGNRSQAQKAAASCRTPRRGCAAHSFVRRRHDLEIVGHLNSIEAEALDRPDKGRA
jgi:hypothetical protein